MRVYQLFGFCSLALVCSTPALAQDPGAGTVQVPGLRKLSIGGEYRLRFEDFYNYDQNRDAADDRDFFTQRFRLNFAADINERFGAYFQLQDVRNWGIEASTTSAAAPGLDVHQGWLEMRDVPGIGGVGRIGRQVISLGDQRLIGGLEWASQGRAFDGYLQVWEGEGRTLRAFVLQVAEPSGGVAAQYSDAFVLGSYNTWQLDKGEFDAYLIHLNDEETTAGGTHNRSSLGLRYVQRHGDWELGTELVTQFGEQDGQDIPFGETLAAHLHATWHCAEGHSLRAELNHASGDDPGSADLERFNNLFPTAHAHLGMMDLALWENVNHAMLQWQYKPCAKRRLALSWHAFETVEETDVFRGPANSLTGAAGRSNSIGNEIDLLWHMDFDHKPVKTYLQIGLGTFLPGSGAEAARAGNDDMAHFLYVMGGLKF